MWNEDQSASATRFEQHLRDPWNLTKKRVKFADGLQPTNRWFPSDWDWFARRRGEKKKRKQGEKKNRQPETGGKKSRKRRNARDQDGGALCTLDREREREREMRWARNRNGSRGRMGIIALEMQQGSSPYSNLKAATASAKLLTLRRAHMTRSATGDANLLRYTDTPCAPPCIDTRRIDELRECRRIWNPFT